jgi:hypothetical protein
MFMADGLWLMAMVDRWLSAVTNQPLAISH